MKIKDSEIQEKTLSFVKDRRAKCKAFYNAPIHLKRVLGIIKRHH